MIAFKNRDIDYTKPVFVYRNLTKDCFSVQQNGRVVAHAQNLSMRNNTFNVCESGRQKVLKTGQKNVHAKIKGFLVNNDHISNLPNKINYNPYKYNSFVNTDLTNSTISVKSALLVKLQEGKIYAIGLNKYATKNS